MSAGQAILALNAGSSSLKFALYDVGAALTPVASGEVENLGSTRRFVTRDANGAILSETRGPAADFAAMRARLLDFVDAGLPFRKMGERVA
jgi:acetate kinase